MFHYEQNFSPLTKETIAIIIPTYNEKKNIKHIIGAIRNILPTGHIVVVDDNSPDLTGKEVAKLEKEYSNIHLIERKEKSGRGSAVIAGFAYALKNKRAQIFIEMDADFSHDPQELSQLIGKVDDKTFVIASRYLSVSKIYGWPVSRRILSYFANVLIRFLLKIPVHDYTNGYRAYSRKAIEILVNHTFITSGYILLSEIIVVLYKSGFTNIGRHTEFCVMAKSEKALKSVQP